MCNDCSDAEYDPRPIDPDEAPDAFDVDEHFGITEYFYRDDAS